MFLFSILMRQIPSESADSSNWFSLMKLESSNICRISWSLYVTFPQSLSKTTDALELDGEQQQMH